MKRFLLVALGCLALIVIVVVVQRGEDKTQPEGPVEPPAEVRPTPAAPAISPEEEKARQEVARIALGIKPDLATPKLIELLEKLGVLEQDFQTPEGKKLLADARARIAELHNERFNALIGRSKALADEWKFEEAKKVLVDARSGDFAAFAEEIDARLAQIAERRRLTTIYPEPQTPRFLQGVRDQDFEPLRLTEEMLDEKRGYEIDYHNYRPVELQAGRYTLRQLYNDAIEIDCNGATVVGRLWTHVYYERGDAPQRDWDMKRMVGRAQRRGSGWRLTIREFWQDRNVVTSIYDVSRRGVRADFSVDFGDRPWLRAATSAELTMDSLRPVESLELSVDGKPLPPLDPSVRHSHQIGPAGTRVRAKGSNGFVSFTTVIGNGSYFTRHLDGNQVVGYILSRKETLSTARGVASHGVVDITAATEGPPPIERAAVAALPKIPEYVNRLLAVRHLAYPDDLGGPWSAGDFAIDNKGAVRWKGTRLGEAIAKEGDRLCGVEILTDGASLKFERIAERRRIRRHLFATVTSKCALYSIVTDAGPYRDWEQDFGPGEIKSNIASWDSAGVRVLAPDFKDATTIHTFEMGTLFRTHVFPLASRLGGANQALVVGPSRRLSVATRYTSNLGTMLSASPVTMWFDETPYPDIGVRCSWVDSFWSVRGVPIQSRADILVVPQEGVGPLGKQ